MKKTVIRLTALTLTAIILLGCLTSCDLLDKLKLQIASEEELPYKIFYILTENMSELDSYVMKSEITMLAKIDNETADITVLRTVIETDIGGDNYTYREETVTDTVSRTESTRTEETEGYAKGKMYRSYSDGNISNKIFSNVSKEDFRTHNGPMPLNVMSFDEDFCNTAIGTQYEDGTWQAVFTDFTIASIIVTVKYLASKGDSGVKFISNSGSIYPGLLGKCPALSIMTDRISSASEITLR